MAEAKQFELTIAEKIHNPLQANPKHIVGNNFHVGNVRLIKGQWTRVNEWWFIKNQALIKKYLDQGQILVKTPDGRILGEGKPAPVMIVGEVPVMPTFTPPPPPPAPEPEPLPAPEPPKEDDFGIFGLKEGKISKLREIAQTFAEVVALDVAGLVEKAHLTPAQADKVLDIAKKQLG